MKPGQEIMNLLLSLWIAKSFTTQRFSMLYYRDTTKKDIQVFIHRMTQS